MNRTFVASALLLVACNRSPRPDTGPTLDTGWFTDTGSGTTCAHHFVEHTPTGDELDWYWRDPMVALAASDRQEAYGARLTTADGILVPTEAAWDAQTLTLTPSPPLAPSTDYILHLSDCTGSAELPFHTSPLGTALDGGPASIIGRAWVIDLDRAEWLEPAGFGPLLALYFTTPLLLGVEWADDTMVDFMGAPGTTDDLGGLHQALSQPSWDFPAAGFTDAPWFSTQAGQVAFEYQGVTVPVHNFSLEATFGADGSIIGGGRLEGLVDTRGLGEFIDEPDDPAAICQLAASMGVQCTPCPDAQPLCLDLHVIDVTADEVNDLTLVPVDE